jgi:hypothetical protein
MIMSFSLASIIIATGKVILAPIQTILDHSVKKTEIKEEARQRAKEEEEETKREKIEADRLNREEEIKANVRIVENSSDNMKDIADKGMQTAADATVKSVDNMKDIADKGMQTVADTTVKMADKNQNIIIDTHEKFRNSLDEIESKHKEEIAKSQEKIHNYQDMLYKTTIEIIRQRTIKEIKEEFAQNVLTLVEAKAKYEENVSKTKNDIKRIKNNLKPLQDELQKIEIEIKILESHYKKLNNDFDTLIKALDELKYEYKHNMDESKYYEIYRRKYREQKRIVDDIEQKELELLNRELERLNKIEEMEPLLQEIERNEIALEYLENEHDKLIQIGMHKLNNSQLEKQNMDESVLEEGDIIDVPLSDLNKTEKSLSM